MEKVNTTNTTTDIFVGDKNVGNFTLTTFNNGTMNANFMINDASTFHGSPEAAQDLVNLVNDSISQSKALTTIKANQKVGVMESVIQHALAVVKDVIDNWGAVTVVSIIIGSGYRILNKKQELRDKAQEDQLLIMRQEIKRIELSQAINHDYGLQIVSGIFDEYTALGGNHYAHEIYEKYKKEKEEK